VEFADHPAIHIDDTFVSLAPGKVMVNPDGSMRQVTHWLNDHRTCGDQ
jgi:hypothetical protein